MDKPSKYGEDSMGEVGAPGDVPTCQICGSWRQADKTYSRANNSAIAFIIGYILFPLIKSQHEPKKHNRDERHAPRVSI